MARNIKRLSDGKTIDLALAEAETYNDNRRAVRVDVVAGGASFENLNIDEANLEVHSEAQSESPGEKGDSITIFGSSDGIYSKTATGNLRVVKTDAEGLIEVNLAKGTNNAGNPVYVQEVGATPIRELENSEYVPTSVGLTSTNVTFSQDVSAVEIKNNSDIAIIYVDLNGGIASTSNHLPLGPGEFYFIDRKIAVANGISIISNTDATNVRIAGHW